MAFDMYPPQVIGVGTGVGISAGTNLSTSGTVVFSNSNGVTFGMNNVGVITASVVAGGGGIANAAGSQTATSGTVVFSNSNNVTFGMSNSSVVTASFSQSNQTVASGNIAGTGFTTTTTAGLSIAGTHDTAGLKLAVPAYLTAQTNQTVASGNIAGTGFTTTTTAGLSVAGTHDTAGLKLAVPAYLTTYVAQTTQTQPAGNIAGVGTTFAGTNVSGSMTLNTNGLNLALSAGGGGGFTGGVSTGGNTLGNTGTQTGSLIFVGGNNITLSVGTAAGGAQTITISGAAAGGAQTAISSVGVGGATYTSGQIQFVNSNNFTFLSTTGQGIVGSFSTTPQSVQTQASGAIAGSGFTSTTTAGVVPVATHNSAGLSMGIPNWITTYAAQTNQTVASGNIAGAGFTTTTTAGSVMVGTQNSAGLSLGVPNWLTVAAGGAFSAGASTDAIGTTGLVNAQLVFFEGANISLSQSVNGQSASLSISAAAGGGTPYTASWFQPEVWGNTLTTTHANGTLYIRPFELNGYQDFDYAMIQQSLNTSASTVSFSYSNSTGASFTSGGTGSWGQTGTLLLFSRANTNETNASYNSIVSFFSRTYSMGGAYSVTLSNSSFGVNGSSGGVVMTTAGGVSFINNIDSAGGFTTTAVTTSSTVSFSSSSAAQNSFSTTIGFTYVQANMTGIRPVFMPGSGTDMPPGAYWIGLIQSTTTGSTGYSLQRVVMQTGNGMLYFTGSGNNSYLEIGNTANISSSNYRLGYGSYSASTNTTGNIPLSAITSMANNASMWFAIAGQTR